MSFQNFSTRLCRRTPSRQPDVGSRGDDHPGSIPHLRLPGSEGLLPRVDLHARQCGLPAGALLQPLRGAPVAGALRAAPGEGDLAGLPDETEHEELGDGGPGQAAAAPARRVETVIGMLKRGCQIEHARHRSFPGFVANLCSGLIAYSFLPNKPKIHLANGSAAIHQTML